MFERELIIAEWWKRCANTVGVKFTARNPKDPPNDENMPCILFFEGEDIVEQISSRGASGFPTFRRRLQLITSLFMIGDSEASSTKEMGLWVQAFKKSLYADGTNLGGRLGCSIEETSMGRVVRPPVGAAYIGVELT